MRLSIYNSGRQGASRRLGAPGARQRAFTLAEMMIATAVFSMVVLGLIYAQLVGMKYDQLVASKLGASDLTRKSFDLLTSEIREAKIWAIGNGNRQEFLPCGNGTNQQGNALQLHLTGNTNTYVRYYFDTTNGRLCRCVSGALTSRIIAEHLTNTMLFRAERYDGTIAQDWQYKNVIATSMEFAQLQYPLMRVGSNSFYNSYRVQFRATSHCP